MELTRHPITEDIPLLGPVSITVREFELRAFKYPWHRHPEVELTWILEGAGLRYVGDSVEPFQAGDFCLLGTNLPHAWLSSHPAGRAKARSLVVQFDSARLAGAFQLLPEFAGIGRLLQRATHGLSFDPRLGLRLREKMLRHSSGLFRLTALLEILEELAAHSGARALALAPWTRDKKLDTDARLRRVLAHLTNQIGDTIAQTQYARLTGLSPAGFSRFFTRAMGRTFQSYVCDLRLSLACRKLLETDQPVSEIAYAVGFGNLSNFNRSFRLRRGMSPREFRRQSLRHS